MRVADAVVLLTGSCRGIGSACAQALSAHGARVILHARDADLNGASAAALGAKVLSADLTRAGAAEALADAARDVYGHVDIVVHCAGVGWYGDTAAMSPPKLDEILDVDLRAPLRLTCAVLPDMLARGYGHVAFIASIAGLTGVARESVYAAAKAGLVTFADSLRLELAGTGVGVSTISPAAVRTEFFEHRGVPYGRRLPRPVAAERVAAAVVRGIEHDRANQIVPHWLAIAPAVRGAVPPLFRSLSRRFG
jgi:short-subunit dehydrogenase